MERPPRPGVEDAVAAARARIAAAAGRAGRDPARVLLIAVTKTVGAERVAEAIAAGVSDLGENRVQEAAAKRLLLPGGCRWHLIGHLQTNKAARAAGIFDTVHSVDSLRVAEALAQRRPPDLADLDVLLEIELTGIPGRTGLGPDDAEAAVREVAGVPRLRLRGLMTMAAQVTEPELARPAFATLRRLRDRLQESTGTALPELSMGMSDDFEVAVEEGSTVVRLGRALFGARPPRPVPVAAGVADG